MVGSKMSIASPARSAPSGLIALLFHLCHAASQGQLDPALVRDLGKRIHTEVDACKTDDTKSQVAHRPRPISRSILLPSRSVQPFG